MLGVLCFLFCLVLFFFVVVVVVLSLSSFFSFVFFFFHFSSSFKLPLLFSYFLSGSFTFPSPSSPMIDLPFYPLDTGVRNSNYILKNCAVVSTKKRHKCQLLNKDLRRLN